MSPKISARVNIKRTENSLTMTLLPVRSCWTVLKLIAKEFKSGVWAVRELDKLASAINRGRMLCPGCRQEIDPEICHCGEMIEGHGDYYLSHGAVPMGCDCHRSKR